MDPIEIAEFIEAMGKRADSIARDMYERGFEAGFEAGLNLAYSQHEEAWVELYGSGRMSWLRAEPYAEMEERRYGPLPDDCAEYASPEERRVARARCPREGDFKGEAPW